MKKWIIDKTETIISVHEEGNPENYALREKANLTYGDFGEITGFKFDNAVIKQAYKICDDLNELGKVRVERDAYKSTIDSMNQTNSALVNKLIETSDEGKLLDKKVIEKFLKPYKTE